MRYKSSNLKGDISPFLHFSIPKVVGILNITPDSFYDGGRYINPDTAINHIDFMIKSGADIIDVGGESSRPGAIQISVEEELKRVIPVFDILRDMDLGVVELSIDTYKSKVAEECIKRGASIVNDISGMRFDKNMPYIVRDYDVKIVIMHMKGSPKDMQDNPYYDDVIKELLDFFKERIDFALSIGIKEENIIIDPGIGFGKRVSDNLEILANLDKFKELGFPIFIGHSMKSFIEKTTGASLKERIYETLSLIPYFMEMGIDYIRVHDVLRTKRIIKLMKSIFQFRR